MHQKTNSVQFCVNGQIMIPFAKFNTTQMDRESENNYLLKYIEALQGVGRYSFSLKEVEKKFKNVGNQAVATALKRLSAKGKVVSVHKGFYVIITAEYANRGVLPAVWFIDSLMSYLKKPYYVGLLSASALHGAAHQQPQEFFVVTDLPVLRTKAIKGLKINFISKTKILPKGIDQKKTETGFIKVSGPELTVLDIIQFEGRIGGLNRVITILDELLDNVDLAKLKTAIHRNVSHTVIQRLGYISEKILEKKEVATMLREWLKGKQLSRIPLKAGGKRSGFTVDPDWKVIINTKPESDL
jgi:predicted transcriptional regulator of viral defense system